MWNCTWEIVISFGQIHRPLSLELDWDRIDEPNDGRASGQASDRKQGEEQEIDEADRMAE